MEHGAKTTAIDLDTCFHEMVLNERSDCFIPFTEAQCSAQCPSSMATPFCHWHGSSIGHMVGSSCGGTQIKSEENAI